MTRTATLRLRNRGIALPDMVPFASLIFLLLLLFLPNVRILGSDPGIVQSNNLPQSFERGCGKITEANGVIISLDTLNRFSFAVTSSKLQAVAIQRVAGHYGIQFTALQQEAASAIPYLSTSVTTLAEFLSQPVYERVKPSKNFGFLTEQQLFDCVTATRNINTILGFHHLHTWLRIDANVKATRVAQLLDSLQVRGSQGFFLSTININKTRPDMPYQPGDSYPDEPALETPEDFEELGPYPPKNSPSIEQ